MTARGDDYRRRAPRDTRLTAVAAALVWLATSCEQLEKMDTLKRDPGPPPPEQPRVKLKDVKGPLGYREMKAVNLPEQRPVDFISFLMLLRIQFGAEFRDVAAQLTAPPKISARMKDTVLKDLMQLVIEKEPAYAWDLQSNVLAYFPKGADQDPSNPLNLAVPPADQRNINLEQALRIGLDAAHGKVVLLSAPSALQSDKFNFVSTEQQTVRYLFNRAALMARRASWYGVHHGGKFYLVVTRWGQKIHEAGVGDLVVDGPDADGVRKLLVDDGTRLALAACMTKGQPYAEYLPNLATMKFTVAADGAVSSLQLGWVTPRGDALTSCVSPVIEQLKFPPAKGDRKVSAMLALFTIEREMEGGLK